MAWYPGATKRELQPESDAQPAIRPTQFILHSIAAPWNANRVYEYWRDSTNLESHFGLGYEGDLAQFIGTHTRADSTAAANRRPDGSGAVSLESASNLGATDPWTDAQVEQIIKLGVWLHKQEGIPLRICRTADDPGYGHHRMFKAWNPDAHSCPGPARVRQFHDVIFPGIVARASGTTTDKESPVADLTAKDVWSYKNTEQGEISDVYAYVRNTKAKVDDIEATLDRTGALVVQQQTTLAGIFALLKTVNGKLDQLLEAQA